MGEEAETLVEAEVLEGAAAALLEGAAAPAALLEGAAAPAALLEGAAAPAPARAVLL